MLHVFVSHARSDEAAAQILATHLAQEVRAGDVRLWLQPAHAVVAPERARRLAEAHVLVVLLSGEWVADAALCQEAQAARQRGTVVLPVRWRDCKVARTAAEGLQTVPKDGLAIARRALQDQDAAWLEVANAIVGTEPPTLQPESTVGDLLRAALHLDRQPQWHVFEKEHRAGGSVLFYLQGPWEQNVGAFAWRLRSHFLRELPGEPHDLITLRLPAEEPRPRVAEGWVMLLKDELHRRRLAGTTADALLAAATHERPLFLLLGPPPLDEDSLEGCEKGLQAFVTEALPALLCKARVRHPVRGLLCVQHHEDRSLVDRLLGWPEKTAPGLRPCVLPPLTLPGRQDIVEYLDRYHPPLPATVKQRVLVAYDRMVERRRTLTFEDLTRLLDQHLDQYAGVAPP